MIYDTINPEIVAAIGRVLQPGMRILDIGCGTGKLGRELKAKAGCILIGIELDGAAVLEARKIYDEVSGVDLEDIIRGKAQFIASEKFDVIIYGDILEHVTDPAKLLNYFSRFLKDGGTVVASIPNVANWMVRLGLLFGHFDYDGGIRDQGHLKFYTYKSARALLEHSGLQVVSVVNNNATWIMKLLGRMWKEMFSFQFVFTCRQKA